MDRWTLIAVFLFTGSFGEAAAQRLQPGTQAETGAISVSAKVGGKSYQGSGSGSCRHAAEASIHGVSAALWMVQFAGKSGPMKQLNLTLWRPKDGDSDQLSLDFEAGTGSHRIETGGSGGNSGQGSVTILPSGPGGRLEISGKESGGKPVQLTIDCPVFGDIEAEGG
jgi:hypothetical protein